MSRASVPFSCCSRVSGVGRTNCGQVSASPSEQAPLPVPLRSSFTAPSSLASESAGPGFRGVMTAVTFHSYGNRLWRMRHRTAKFRAAKVRVIMRRLYPPTAHQSRKHKYRLDVMGV